MPRRVKPPGRKNWTWAEIEAGYKPSRGAKRAKRRVETMIGKRPDGSLNSFAENPAGWLLFFVFMIITAVGVFASVVGGK